jgi:uncharacterized protein
MLKTIHANKGIQLILGLLLGIIFGFLLQKGGVTTYDVIINQLLLNDFTVVKIMLSAVLTGMIGVHLLRSMGLAQLHPKPGAVGSTVLGGLIFGIGFGTLGYCPGTAAGAIGQGCLDALLGGVAGILIGAGLFAAIYHKIHKPVLSKGHFGEITLPELFNVNHWVVVTVVAIVILALLGYIEKSGV